MIFIKTIIKNNVLLLLIKNNNNNIYNNNKNKHYFQVLFVELYDSDGNDIPSDLVKFL